MSVADKADIAQDPALSALAHWIRSAGQQNVDSLVKVGDSYCESGTHNFTSHCLVLMNDFLLSRSRHRHLRWGESIRKGGRVLSKRSRHAGQCGGILESGLDV